MATTAERKTPAGPGTKVRGNLTPTILVARAVMLAVAVAVAGMAVIAATVVMAGMVATVDLPVVTAGMVATAIRFRTILLLLPALTEP